jgi:hypothetical protein
VSGTARRAIGNYQEGVVIVRVLDDGSYQHDPAPDRSPH